jgi:hypothetical protein
VDWKVLRGAIIERGLESGSRLTERMESRDTLLERTESGGGLSNFSSKKMKEKGSVVSYFIDNLWLPC